MAIILADVALIRTLKKTVGDFPSIYKHPPIETLQS
jgi:hypothetical protein